MTESRFSFLKEDFPDLYEKCVQAEQAVESDVAMLRIRQTLEYIVRDLGAQSQDLFQSINELEGRNIINLKISQRFHDVRRMANQAVHGNAAPDKDNVRQCLDNLLLLMVWYGVEKGKTYTLDQFSPSDVASVRSYLVNAGNLPKEAAVYEVNPSQSIDPLQLAGSFQFSEDDSTEQNELERDVFETQEEYEQRIAAMEPVHIGYGILDTRRKDGYTDVNFLVHHVDHNSDIQFSPISAFYTTRMTEEQVIDSELVAKLKVHKDKICCDYSQVYLQHDGNLTPVHPIYWDTFFYENEAEFNERISTMPLLPFGMAMAVRREYDLTTKELPFVINPFRYAEQVLKNFLPENKRMVIQCNRDMAKNVCNEKKPCILFLKLHTLEAIAKNILWRKDVGEIVENNYPKASDWYRKEIRRGNTQAQVMLEKAEAAEKISEMEALKLAANQGDVKAQKEIGDCYYNGKGLEKDYQKAVEWYQKAAEHGEVEAQNHLGNCYRNGEGVEKDYRKAVEWYRKAAEQGYAEAQNHLGNCYHNGEGVEKDYRKAVEWYQKAAEQGHAEAQYNYGSCYCVGEGVEKDYSETVKWFQLSAEQGYANAQTGIGKCYEEGYGVEKNYQKALKWYRKAAEQGDAEAQEFLGNSYFMGKGVNQDYWEAVEWYRKAVEQGYGRAECHLGICYDYGYGVDMNFQQAAEWYRKAGDRGDALAQKCLGNCYYNGRGVEKDYRKAVEWYLKAADQGDAEAQYQLGFCYDNGYGVEKNYQKAVEWYQKSAKQGNRRAQYNLETYCHRNKGHEPFSQDSSKQYQKEREQGNKQVQTSSKVKNLELAANRGDVKAQRDLGNYYYHGKGADRDCRKAVEWYRKAAEQGDSAAQYKLGYCYYTGKGCDKDYPEAIKWFRKAAEQGHADAQSSLGTRYYTGEGVDKDYYKAVEWYRKAAAQGHAWAQNNLGRCYYNGQGVKQDYRQAIEWYQEAAAQGHVQARHNLEICYQRGMVNDQNYRRNVKRDRKSTVQKDAALQFWLGNCYLQGTGVEKNCGEAVEFYQKAADKGHSEAQYCLGHCYYKGTGIKQAYQKAVEWYQKAAEQNHAAAQCNLGNCYSRGEGVEKDYRKAREWYWRAAEQGCAWAQYHLGHSYQHGEGVDRDIVKAVEWYRKAASEGKDDAELQKRVGEVLEEIQKSEKIQKGPKTNKSGCFITTAVCDSLQKDDDCYELTAFRRFRDDWLARQADGPLLIEEYYDVAPKIVEVINTKSNRDEIYQAILRDYLRPCVTLIECGRYAECKALYMEMVRLLQHKYMS